MKPIRYWLIPVALTALLAGCATTDDAIDDAEMAEIDQAAAAEAQTGDGDGSGGGGAAASGATGTGSVSGEPLEDPDSPLSDRVIYFDYDSSTLSEDAMALIEAHGEYLANNGDRRMLVEGHTDERGSREYNLALGERRAESVEQALLISGADDDQVETVSYGEESPAVSGSGESVWSENRRAALVYER
ncbi:peptidoglycan-associated lipoprotein Pal [Spiribacter vilamensis]|uniref:Peptidoglycan-associated lipoprotein n=1 Tax=Spiribacter vilamensis TaxID=531306 RepID=A0A4Q8D147_9GAMM|nr:peptidoglycan-associated lipoprotein Pal [Spiribacter vilamensis]RZU99069.1 peptidoglycan-associated lipoprotein [Spiribacter vilamensis]TVO61933.1 peptidoglycan-associated lipoprotein Pal [Spiribacter vilamensis]